MPALGSLVLPAPGSPQIADSPPAIAPCASCVLVVSRPSLSRDWYMNGNYLVILVSITVILPLALMKQLGKLWGPQGSHGVMVPTWGWWAGTGHPDSVGVLPAPTSRSPPSAGYLGYASGFSLSCMGFFLISVSTGRWLWTPSIPSAGVHGSTGVQPGCELQWDQRGQRVLQAVEMLWWCCHTAGLFLVEGAKCQAKGKAEGAGEKATRAAPPRATAPL